jgi:MFS family permease
MAGFASDASDDKSTFAEYFQALRACPRELWLIYLATCLEFIGVYSFLSTLTLWLSGDFGMKDTTAGWVATAFSMVLTGFVFLVGSLADYFGMRRMLLASFALSALARLSMALSTTVTLAIFSLFAFAFAYATSAPVLQASVQRASTKKTRGLAYALWYSSFNIGGALSGPLVTATRKAFLDPTTHKLVARTIDLPFLGPRLMTANAAVMGLGFVAALLAVGVMLLLRSDFEHRQDPADAAGPVAKRTNPLRAMREAASDEGFWRFMVMLLFLSLVRMMFQHMHFTWNKYVLRIHGDAFAYADYWALNSLLIIPLAPLVAVLTRRRKPLDVLLFGAFISALSPFVLCLGSAAGMQLAMILTLTLGEALWSPRLYEYNISIAPRGRETTYLSLASLPFFLAKFLVTPSSGYLLTAYCPESGTRHPEVMWGIIGVSTMLGPIGIWLGRGWLTKKSPAVEAA